MVTPELYAALPRTRDELMAVIHAVARMIGADVAVTFPTVDGFTPGQPIRPAETKRRRR